MGEVYRARDTRLGREVALKVLPAASLADDTARARLLREARLASQLNHPHICTIHEAGEAGGHVFVAMELVEGQTLGARLAAGPLPAGDLLRYGSQIADALEHAHARGVVHRDLKSANVVITPDGRAKVLDFGLAKRLETADLDEVTRPHTAVTEPGALVGTLPYMAPEQLRGAAADARSDIWAFGVVLYEMAAGRRPFEGRTAFDLSSAILGQAAPPLPPSVGPGVGATIARCLDKEPGRRYQRAGEVRAALDAIQSGVSRTTEAAWRDRLRRGHRAAAVGLAGMAAALAALAAFDAGGLRTRLSGGGAPGEIRMAVLPFQDRGGNPGEDYLGDGLTDELTVSLGRLAPDVLKVVGGTSVRRYKGRDTPIDEIGRELRLDYVLEGTVRRQADGVHVTAALIDVRDQAQLMAASFDRALADVGALQGDVARRVADTLALALRPEAKARLASARAVNPEAYEAWSRATQARKELTRDGLDRAERDYRLALEKDPSYAAAWAGLARVWNGRQQMGITPPREAAQHSKTAALKALALDEGAWEAHRAMAGILTWTDWDWPVAEREWTRLLELSPNSDSLAGYSHFLMHVGRQAEALAHGARAVELDPFDAKAHSFRATGLLYARRYDEAIAAARAALAIQPTAPVALTALKGALFMQGRRDEELALEQAQWARDAELTAAMARGQAEAGYAGAFRRLAETLAARFGGRGGVSTYHLAELFTRAGEKERALEWLERGYEEHNPNMPYLGQPIWDSLRGDARFRDLLRRMKLPA